MKKILFAIAMSASVLAQASLLNFEGGDQKVENVVLNKTATVSSTNAKLELLGAGVRSKKVLIVDAKVYVLQLFSDSKASFNRDANSALTSLVNNSKTVALKLDLLRTISASALSDSLKEALAANGYAADAETTALLALFSKSAEPAQGKSLSVVLAKDPASGKTNVYYEDAAGSLQSMVGSPEMMTKILSIWLGKPVDSGIEKLKASLMQVRY